MFKGQETVYYVSNLNGEYLSREYFDRNLAVQEFRNLRELGYDVMIRYKVIDEELLVPVRVNK